MFRDPILFGQLVESGVIKKLVLSNPNQNSALLSGRRVNGPGEVGS